MKVLNIQAKQINDSQRKPTVAVELETEQGVFSASVPAGISTGKYEAVLVEPKKAVENVNKIIAQKLTGQEFSSQKQIDQFLIELDGSANKAILGSNALLAVSIAACRGLAQSVNLPLYRFVEGLGQASPDSGEGCSITLPKPMVLLMEGGKHNVQAVGAEIKTSVGGLDTQEFLVVPQAKTFSENFKIASELYKTLEKVLIKHFSIKGVLTGAEGGFTPPVQNTEQTLDLIMQAIEQSNLQNKVKLALDVASSGFFQAGVYHFESQELNAEKLSEFYLNILKNYPIVSLEDPFAEEDWPAWQAFFKQIKPKEQLVVGDDLTVTNSERIKQAQEKQAVNAVIIKPNQIGTVTETIESAQLAQSFGWQIIVSHRAGETRDDFIADLAIGLRANYIKTGGPQKPERRAKYDRVLAIEKEIISKDTIADRN